MSPFVSRPDNSVCFILTEVAKLEDVKTIQTLAENRKTKGQVLRQLKQVETKN
jgi:hypothetical protein